MFVLIHGNRRRFYLAYFPERRGSPPPLVVNFHGGGSSISEHDRMTKMADHAAQHGYAVVFPQGSGSVSVGYTWNAGQCCGHAKHYNIDDVGFFEAMLQDVSRRFAFDSRRVVVTGISNGGMLAYRIARALPGLIAMAAPVASADLSGDVPISSPVPLLVVHGGDDRSIPECGGRGAAYNINPIEYPSVAESISMWRRVNRTHPVTSKQFPGFRQDDYSGRHPIRVVIHRGGHVWPGGVVTRPELGADAPTPSTNDLILDFLNHLSKAGETVVREQVRIGELQIGAEARLEESGPSAASAEELQGS